MVRYLGIALLFICVISLVDARAAKYKPSRPRDGACSTNTECLQKGLPPMPPRPARQRIRRQANDFVPISTTTCGTAEATFLLPGSYQVSLSGARGASNGRAGALSAGGSGTALTATLIVTSNSSIGYFVGCVGLTADLVGGGGGGSYVYVPGENQPAILVAGAGGGGAFAGNRPGRPGGTTFDGVATQADGTPGATGGAGGQIGTGGDENSGGAGGGFQSAGASTAGAAGGSQSINFGGDFGGGVGNGFVSGGAGGGGGAGFFRGGGGGGWSGGGGSGSPQFGAGGGGGGSYAAPSAVGGISVTTGTIAATNAGMGSLTIVKLS